MNQCAFRHSARNLPLNDSMKILSVSLAGREKSSVTLCWYAQNRDCVRQTRSPGRPRIAFRKPYLPADLFKYVHNIRAAEGERRFDCGREARERINDREHPQLAAGCQLVDSPAHAAQRSGEHPRADKTGQPRRAWLGPPLQAGSRAVFPHPAFTKTPSSEWRWWDEGDLLDAFRQLSLSGSTGSGSGRSIIRPAMHGKHLECSPARSSARGPPVGASEDR